MKTTIAFACLGSFLAATTSVTPASAKSISVKGVAGPCACVPARHLRRVVRTFIRSRRSIDYGWALRVPRYDPRQVWAEVHTWYPYRTPYPYPGLYGW